LAFAGGQILSPGEFGPAGASVRLIVQARDVMVAVTRPDGLSALNVLPASIRGLAEAGPASVDVTLDCGGTELVARLTRRSAGALELAPGRGCHAVVKSVALARIGRASCR